MADSTLRRWFRELRGRRRTFKKTRTRIHRLKGAIASRKRALQSAHGGPAAVKFLLDRAGWHEEGSSNDSTFLANWRRELNMGWMRGQPWCGLACLAAWHYGAHKDLPADTVSTVAILNRARSGNGYKAVSSSAARPGDLVVFNFPGGEAAEHVALARGPARGGWIPTVEGNTSPSNGGSQSNGGSIQVRTRPVGLIAVVARPI